MKQREKLWHNSDIGSNPCSLNTGIFYLCEFWKCTSLIFIMFPLRLLVKNKLKDVLGIEYH